MPGFNISKPFSKEAESTDHNMGRFTIKAAVLLLTRFEEVRASVAQYAAGALALRTPVGMHKASLQRTCPSMQCTSSRVLQAQHNDMVCCSS